MDMRRLTPLEPPHQSAGLRRAIEERLEHQQRVLAVVAQESAQRAAIAREVERQAQADARARAFVLTANRIMGIR